MVVDDDDHVLFMLTLLHACFCLPFNFPFINSTCLCFAHTLFIKKKKKAIDFPLGYNILFSSNRK